MICNDKRYLMTTICLILQTFGNKIALFIPTPLAPLAQRKIHVKINCLVVVHFIWGKKKALYLVLLKILLGHFGDKLAYMP